MRWGRGIPLAVCAILVLLGLTSGAAARACPNADRSAVSTPRGLLRNAVRCLINRERTERALPPLAASPPLSRSAQSWTTYLVRSHTFTHGHDFAARLSAAGFDWASAGEDIATGFETPRQVVRGWMASAGHCQNILDPQFAALGTGISPRATGPATGGGTWTVDFGLRQGSAAPSGNWAPARGCPY